MTVVPKEPHPYESGAPYLIDVERWASRGRLPPRAEGGYLSVAFEADGRLRAGLHDRIERWDFSQVPVRALVFREGVSDLAVAPNGELVAIAHGANLSLLNLTERRVIRSQSWQSELVRTVAFDPFTPAQGPPELIAASFGERGARRLSLGRHLGFLPFELLIRRAVALSENRLLVSDFFRKLWVLAPDRAPTPGPPIDAQMHAMCDGRHLAILDPKAAIWFRRDWAPGLELEPVQERTQAIAIGCSDAERVFAVERSGVVELSTDMNAMGAHVMRYDAKDSDLVSGAVSQTALAAGARDGSVFLWKKGESRPIAIVRDHDRRVDRVAFDPSGRWLVAGDWDGRLLFIDALPQARALDSSGSAAAWGLDLDTLIPER